MLAFLLNPERLCRIAEPPLPASDGPVPIGSKRKVVSDLVDLRWDGAVYKLDVPGEAEAGSAGTQPS